jgi:integrase
MNTQDSEKMTFNAVKQNHRKLAENPKISDHNKQVLNEFFRKMGSKGTGQTALKDYASRFNTLSRIIDFPLDQAEKEDIENIVNALNTNELRKLNGEPYADYSKDDIWKAVRVFYNKFIKKEGRGFKKELDGPKLVDDLDVNVNLSTDIDIDTRPTPEHVQKLAEQADNLRDRALVLFGWATGARIGEIAKTADSHKYPGPIKWEDIRFKEREMHVTLRGKSGERTIPIRVSMPLMKQLQNQQNPDLSSPVFKQKNQENLCPKCGNSNLDADRNKSYSKRVYKCQSESCSWKGKVTEADKNRKAMTGDSTRRMFQRLLKKAKNRDKVPNQITKKPHWFWRDGRALYWAAKDKNENFLRAFFGWSETSDAPKHYIELMQESVLAGVRED